MSSPTWGTPTAGSTTRPDPVRSRSGRVLAPVCQRPAAHRRHTAMTEKIPPPSGQATVVLDIGPGVGALILHTPAELDGLEIEISRSDIPDAVRTHSQVRERRTGASVRYAAVYPDLAAGEYTLWRDEVTPLAEVSISGGAITNCQWPA